MTAARRWTFAMLFVASAVLIASACGEATAETTASGSEGSAPADSASKAAKPEPQRRAPIDNPQVSDASDMDWATVSDKSVIVAFFSQRMRDLKSCLESYQRLHDEREGGNLAVVAVCIDSDRPRDLRATLADNGFTLPVLIDSQGQLRKQYEPTSMPHAFFFAEGQRFLGSLPGFPDGDATAALDLYTNLMRRSVGLDVKIENDPLAVPLPKMPAFVIKAAELDSSDLAGSPYVLTFVAAGCDRCKAQLQLFKQLETEFADSGLRFLVVLVDEGVDPEKLRAERDLPFAIHSDPGAELRRTLGYRGLVPDTFVVDDDARIRFRHTTHDVEQAPLFRMELRRLLGKPNPPILKSTGPSGARRCMICHEREYFDWMASGHAHAMRSLQAIGKAEDPKCIKCHVVGFGEPGGYDADGGARAALLTDVQCESCHGHGGPHRVDSRGQPLARPEITESTCLPCHDHEHSLGFEFHGFRDLVMHRSDLLHADPEQQERLSRAREAARQRLLEPDGKYVGAAACRECHADQFQDWLGSEHAGAAKRMSAAHPGGNHATSDCSRCHVTGVDRTWAEGAIAAADDPAHRGVQCESCHGPGERHIAAGGTTDTIIGLGERCEECVIRQICTTCHDKSNDADFDLDRDLPPMRHRCKPSKSGQQGR